MQHQNSISRLRAQTIHVLKRARKLPPGADRNDLRQLAFGLRELERHRILQMMLSERPMTPDETEYPH